MPRDDLIEIISDVTTLLGDALAKHVDLNESLADGGVESQKMKLDGLKARLAAERLKLSKLKDAAKRKRELEKIMQDHENERARSALNERKATQSRVPLLNAQGRVIGWLHSESGGKVAVYDAKGRIVARELHGITIDRTGRLVGRGRQGLVALGRRLAT